MPQSLTFEQVVGELNGFLFIFPYSGHTEATIQVAAPAYLEACEKANMDKKDFADACVYARQNFTNFPTPAHIIQAHRALMAGARIPRNQPALPPVMSNEQAERGKEWCRRIINEICRGVKRVPTCKDQPIR